MKMGETYIRHWGNDGFIQKCRKAQEVILPYESEKAL
jgi:hypothetical protein